MFQSTVGTKYMSIGIKFMTRQRIEKFPFEISLDNINFEITKFYINGKFSIYFHRDGSFVLRIAPIHSVVSIEIHYALLGAPKHMQKTSLWEIFFIFSSFRFQSLEIQIIFHFPLRFRIGREQKKERAP